MVVACYSALCPLIVSKASRSIQGLIRWGCSSWYIKVMKVVWRWSIANWTASLFRRNCIYSSHLRWLPFLFRFLRTFWRNLLHIAWLWSLRSYIYWWWKCYIRLDVWCVWDPISLKNYIVIIIHFACIWVIWRYRF
jgi:hypothetical protein